MHYNGPSKGGYCCLKMAKQHHEMEKNLKTEVNQKQPVFFLQHYKVDHNNLSYDVIYNFIPYFQEQRGKASVLTLSTL